MKLDKLKSYGLLALEKSGGFLLFCALAVAKYWAILADREKIEENTREFRTYVVALVFIPVLLWGILVAIIFHGIAIMFRSAKDIWTITGDAIVIGEDKPGMYFLKYAWEFHVAVVSDIREFAEGFKIDL